MLIHLFADMANIEDDAKYQKQYWEDRIDILNEKYDKKNISVMFTYSDLPDFNDGRMFDMLLFDWGGMSIDNSMMEHFANRIIDMAKDNPNKIFVIISEFTWRGAFVEANKAGLIGHNIFNGVEEASDYIEEYYFK